LYVSTHKTGTDSIVARIIARVEEAQDSRTRGERIIERFSRYYTPTILAGSLLYLIVTGDLHVALTLLVVSCPGALVIAAPVAVIASIGRAAKRGVLIRGGAELEAAAGVDVFATDKTGTMTTGALAVLRVVSCLDSLDPPPGTEASGEAAVLAWAAIAEGPSEHPIGRAIRTHAESLLGTLPHGEAFAYRAGSGVAATHRGHTIEVARPRPATVHSPEIIAFGRGDRTASTPEPGECERLDEAVANAGRDGMTAVIVHVDSRPVGMIALADTIRSDAAETVAAIRRIGVGRVVLLTGDNEAVAGAVANRVGIDEYHAGLVPDEKLAFIRRLQADGHTVAMLGDGVNDAPALAAADVGIAIGLGGSDLAVEAADLALMTDRLTAIPETLRAARRAVATIRGNLGIAVATVVAFLAGVLLGEIHMAGGMLIHQLSILVVIANGLRLTRGHGRRKIVIT
ncbi:MAG: cation-translocating P-type ATPase, partial [Spirochaetaceae bacterium]